MSTPYTAAGDTLLHDLNFDPHQRQRLKSSILAIEAEARADLVDEIAKGAPLDVSRIASKAVATYLASPEAERALAEALEGFVREDYRIADARAILAAWPKP